MCGGGLAAAPGKASGPSFWLRRQEPPALADSPTGAEGAKALARALSLAQHDLRALAEEMNAKQHIEEAAIFEAQGAFLEDPLLLDSAQQGISEGRPVAESWWHGIERAAAELRALGQEPWLSRAHDLEDVGRRVLFHIFGRPADDDVGLGKGQIVLAHDLTASEVMRLARCGAAGLALSGGSLTAHATILAHALGLPLVIGLGEIGEPLADGTPLALDGDEGLLILWPDEMTTACYQRQSVHPLRTLPSSRPALTTDGRHIAVMANIGNVEEARSAAARGVDGIGLLRTEFLYLGRESLPDEDEQVANYLAILRHLEGRPVVVRTLDASSDKSIPALHLPKEGNPALGFRGLRASRRYLAIQRTQLGPQLRALLRAASLGAPASLRIMFPMIATIDEWRWAREMLRQATDELNREGLALPLVPVGVMIETPAAALMADHLAREADFFSLGTNDLTQYLLAIDRDVCDLAWLADGLQPALLRLLDGVVQAAHRAGKKVSLCGELAADQVALPLLVGLGVDELSMNSTLAPASKEHIGRLDAAEARRLVEECLLLPTAADVRARAQAFWEGPSRKE